MAIIVIIMKTSKSLAVKLLMQTIKTVQAKMAQAIRGHLFKTGSETFLLLTNFTHPLQVIGPVQSKVLSKQQPKYLI